MKQKFAYRLLALAVLCCTFLIYWPGLSGGFFFDDEPNLLYNDWIKLERLDIQGLKKAAFSADSGLLKRPLSMLSFALNYYAAGSFNPYYFKLTNIAIHALNGVALFILTWLLLLAHRGCHHTLLSNRQIQWLTLAITAAWLFHPLNLTSVLYVVQRMASLSVLFMIMGLILYVLGRLRQLNGLPGMHYIIAGFMGGGILALSCKESGALLPVYMLAIEASLFRFQAHAPAKRGLIAFFIVTVALPGLAFLAYFFFHPEWMLRIYQDRGFTLVERLLTESRVLWFYIRLIIVPDISLMGLFHDDIPISRGLTAPLSTLYSVLGLGGLVALAIYFRHRAPLVTLGVCWFLAGHSMESTIIPLEIAHEHRNYLPMYGILFPCFYYLAHFTEKARPAKLGRVLIATATVLFGGATAVRAQQYGDLFGQDLYDVRHHPNSARSNYQAGRALAILIDSDKHAYATAYKRASAYFLRAAALDRNSVDAFFAMIYMSNAAHRPIDPAWSNMIRKRLATAHISANNVSLLANFQKHIGSGKLVLPSSEVISIFQAALQNPALIGESRGMVLVMLGSYYQSHEHDYIAALNLMYEATQAAPRQAIFNLIFARLLVTTGNYEGAREQLNYARKNDRLGIVTDDISAIAESIRKLEAGLESKAGQKTSGQ